jgi:hypothetical protein
VHITGTPIWCDARRRRDVCFVSSADRVGRSEHGQLIGTPIAIALLGAGAGHLAVPLRRPFTLGTLRLELIASGRTIGAAALHVSIGARGVLYAGAIRDAEVRTCDAVVVAAPIDRALPPLAEVAGELVAWTRARLDAKPVLVVDCASDGLEIAARLVADGLPVAGSRAVRDAALRIGELAQVPALRAPGKEPHVLIRVEHERAKDRGPSAHVSVRDGAEFAWPFTADRATLLAWIDQTGAREVFVTGASAESIAAAVGTRAKVLGPPHQMTLFREAT